MKNKNSYLLIIIFIGSLFIFGCGENFFDVPAVGVTSEVNLHNKLGVNELLIGAYTALNGADLGSAPEQVLFGSVRGGSGYKSSFSTDQPAMQEFAKLKVTTGNGNVESSFRYYYDAVFRCNLVLQVVDQAEDMTEAEKTEAKAEARFLRGHYYFYLKRMYGNIPFIDETAIDYKVPNTDENGNYVDCWPEITADLDFARKNLPETQSDAGRPNKWAADIYYAKVLIYRANFGEYTNGYAEALPILTDAINNGTTSSGNPYDLYDAYNKIFNPEYENGPESVFAVQTSVKDGTPGGTRFSNGPNASPIDLWIGSRVLGAPGENGFAFWSPTEWYADHFRVDEDGLPYLDMYNTNPHRLKDDYGMLPPVGVDTFKVDTVPVDPRLDWSAGRRNVPFLGYGPMPGSLWMKDQLFNGPYFIKKYHIWKDQVGTYSDVGFSQNGLNRDIIRFADVLLLAAEVEVRVGSLSQARAYVNRVRQRMIDNPDDPLNRVKLDDGVTDAANYDIGIYPSSGPKDPFQTQDGALDAILYERMLELGLEGHRFYDLVRFGKAEEELSAFIAEAKKRYDYFSDVVYTEVPDALLPIPQNAVDNSQKDGVRTLKQNPGY